MIVFVCNKRFLCCSVRGWDAEKVSPAICFHPPSPSPLLWFPLLKSSYSSHPLSPFFQVPEVISSIRQVSKSALKEDTKPKQEADEAFYNSQKFEVLYCGKVGMHAKHTWDTVNCMLSFQQSHSVMNGIEFFRWQSGTRRLHPPSSMTASISFVSTRWSGSACGC